MLSCDGRADAGGRKADTRGIDRDITLFKRSRGTIAANGGSALIIGLRRLPKDVRARLALLKQERCGTKTTEALTNAKAVSVSKTLIRSRIGPLGLILIYQSRIPVSVSTSQLVVQRRTMRGRSK
jgi:hypothetical protein